MYTNKRRGRGALAKISNRRKDNIDEAPYES